MENFSKNLLCSLSLYLESTPFVFSQHLYDPCSAETILVDVTRDICVAKPTAYCTWWFPLPWNMFFTWFGEYHTLLVFFLPCCSVLLNIFFVTLLSLCCICQILNFGMSWDSVLQLLFEDLCLLARWLHWVLWCLTQSICWQLPHLHLWPGSCNCRPSNIAILYLLGAMNLTDPTTNCHRKDSLLQFN